MTGPLREIKSFVRRDSRMTAAQKSAFLSGWPVFGLSLAGPIDFHALFNRKAPCTLEIGFGAGRSLIAMAAKHPEHDFIGIETHKPGIGALLLMMQQQGVQNIRIFYADAVEVLNRCVPAASFDVIQLFFPDPWPKRRHQKRRLVQPPFVQLIMDKLRPQGALHLATDWEDYAKQMMKVLSATEGLQNLAGPGLFAGRSLQRPLVTKFEQRGETAGRAIWELQFSKI